jgi:SAM-dependent methyltransferase
MISTDRAADSSPDSPRATNLTDRYLGDEHLAHHPTWHIDESAWKTRSVLRMLSRNRINPRTIADIGCGAGEVLRLLQLELSGDVELWGYDISPKALEMSAQRQNDRLHFQLGDIPDDATYDLILALDVVEHVEDSFSFLRAIKPKSTHKIFEIPLDLSVQTVARSGNLVGQRNQHGHIHYFTKELALQLFADTGFVVIDHFYISPALDLPSRSARNLLLRIPRKLMAVIDEDLGARLLGGYRLMILAK